MLHLSLDPSIETDFSGTTFTCAVIRNNKIVLCNIGDSRTSIAYRGKNGSIVADSLTIDHKPDLPAEKVLMSFVLLLFFSEKKITI
jgi:serine/threonine protein phosphatase PrpC